MPDAETRQTTQTEDPGNVHKMKAVGLCKTQNKGKTHENNEKAVDKGITLCYYGIVKRG